MAIKMHQGLKQTQSLMITPQLQQAIKLLTLTHLEMTTLISQEMVENPMLEEMDGKARADFDAIDLFIADHSLDLEAAAEAMATDSRQLAHMLVDINIPATTMRRLAGG